MTVQDLEAHLLQLSPIEKLHIIQLLAQSLNADVVEQQTDRDEKLSDFFRQSVGCIRGTTILRQYGTNLLGRNSPPPRLPH